MGPREPTETEKSNQKGKLVGIDKWWINYKVGYISPKQSNYHNFEINTKYDSWE